MEGRRSSHWKTGRIVAAGALALAVGGGRAARATDLRLDVATSASSADNTSWFSAAHLPALSFPSVNGHDIEQAGVNQTYQSIIQNSGNTLGMYYNDYNTLYGAQTASQAVSTVDSWAKGKFGSAATGKWLVLNEVAASTWQGTDGDSYRTWLVDTINGLSALGYSKIVLYSPRYLASKTYQSTWQALASKAYIGVETYLDGNTIKNTDNFSLSKVQAYYQGYYNSWTSTSGGAGVPASHVFAGEHFSVNLYDPTHYWGANGISGTDWQAAIEIRDIAIHNIPFGGFIGYAWPRNDQATGDDATDLAAQLSYERAYASTMVVQTEVPTWTGNSGTSTSWSDYLNWTGGLPSTTKAPYPLLAATNPTLPKQTTANLLSTIQADTTVTLDGDQSVTHLAVGSTHSYTIASGTGGTLTLTGTGATLDVQSGSHTISAGLTLASATAATVTGNLTVSGPLTNNGVTLTKSNAGTLTISGTQSNATNAALVVQAGTVNVNTDAGSISSAKLAVTASGGTTVFNQSQHLASLTLTGGTVAQRSNGLYLSTKALSVSSTSTLDLTTNDLIVDYPSVSPLAAIRSSIVTGFNGGSWNGKGINTSNGQTNDRVALGYAEASALFGLSGSATAQFDGQTVDATAVLVKYTYYGDADLSGTVTLDDFSQFLDGYQHGGTDWLHGDFDYSGSVTLDDFSQFLYGYQNQGGPLGPLQSAIMSSDLSASDRAVMLAAVEAVPEPTSLALLVLAGAAASSRRRCRRLRP